MRVNPRGGAALEAFVPALGLGLALARGWRQVALPLTGGTHCFLVSQTL